MQYKELAEFYESLSSTSKRLEKTYQISRLIKDAKEEEIKIIVLLAQGKIFPEWERIKIGASDKLVIKAISKSAGASSVHIESEWKRLGDLGSVAHALLAKRKQSSLFPKEFSVRQVYGIIKDLAEHEGKGSVDSKVSAISDMLLNSTPLEAKYIVRTILDNLRVGVGIGSIRDAIAWAFFSEEFGLDYKGGEDIIIGDREKYNLIIERIQNAYDLTNDMGNVALTLKKEGLEGLDKLGLKVGNPVNPMLFQKAKDVKDAFETVGRPAAFEYKYDGFRMQIHLKQKKVQIFTRRLEDVTTQFPDVVESVKHIDAESCIVDAEAVGYDKKTGRYIAFQSMSQRIKRKYDITEVAANFPVELNVFDILFHNDENLLKMPFIERRRILEKIVPNESKKIVLSKLIVTDDDAKAQAFYDESLKMGQEGMMAKNLEGIYKPGARVGFGVKIKSIMDPLDLIIVAAEYGEGKRSGMMTSYVLACKDDEGGLLEIGKVSTGLKELEQEGGMTFEEMSNILKPLIRKTHGKTVELSPEIVIEVGYEEIQTSPGYSSGYALRFPRFLRLREDKGVDDAASIADVERLFFEQRGRNA
jgi:DNA ligase 1